MSEVFSNPLVDSELGWQSVFKTHCGHVRQINEDNGLENPRQAHWVIADGMGGHQAGDIASSMIVNNLLPLQNNSSLADFVDEIEDTLIGVNENLYQLAQSRDTVIGSTVVGAILHEQNVLFYWAGDSRGYILRKNNMVQITRDHTVVQELVDRNEISDEEAKVHRSRNVITRAVGSHKTLYIDYSIVPVEDGDIIFICSDGVEKELSDAEVSKVLSTKEHIDVKAQELLDGVLNRGARDNVSFSIVEILRLKNRGKP